MRRTQDCVCRECALLCALLFIPAAAVHCQEKLETPQQTNAKIMELAEVSRAHPAEATLGSGDLLHIDVFDVEELSRDVRINPDGQFSYPPVPGRILAGGLTTYELQEKLEHLLVENGLVSHPQVSVYVKELTSQPVPVVGAVGKPTVYQVNHATTLIEVIAAAEGLAADAGGIVVVTRPRALTTATADAEKKGTDAGEVKTEAGPQTFTIRLQDLLESGDPSYNIPVYGGDVVSVPRAGIVYVAGAVENPGGFVLQDRSDRITSMKALALAHGPRSTARLNDAFIIRKDPATGAETQIPIRLADILARKTEDVTLMPEDVLLVPDSATKKALYRAGEAALAITTGLTILRVGSR